ncbi:hypothetical protein ACFWVB_02525 [Streptomyces microflavus]|uniref:hypothetical protein n=1 Tax=Streptomyces microflavus TaxID=1919 RepID=UPI003658E3A4
MGFLEGIFPNDRKLAATKYAGRTSATDSKNAAEQKRAERKKTTERTARVKARSRGATKAAAAGEAWEQSDRHKFHRNPRTSW